MDGVKRGSLRRALSGYQPHAPRAQSRCRNEDLFLVMFGFVKFQKQFHMREGVVNFRVHMFFEGVEAFVNRVEAIIGRFGEVAKAVFRCYLRIDQSNDRKNDCDCNRDDLSIGQWVTLAGRLPAFSL